MELEENPIEVQLPFALGRKPFHFTVPDGVGFHVPRPLQDKPDQRPPTLDEARLQMLTALETPLSGPPLKELLQGKRRVLICVGDVTLPSPYDEMLPNLVSTLTEWGIRPSRISFRCCPGLWDNVLGLMAIRRFSEQIVAHHEVLPWRGSSHEDDRSLDPAMETHDLNIGLFPVLPSLHRFLPFIDQLDIGLAIQIHPGWSQRLYSLISGSPSELFSPSEVTEKKSDDSDSGFEVRMVGAGGYPSDATLEEALASLSWLPRSSFTRPRSEDTLVMAFGGRDGLGSARFTLSLWDKLEAQEKSFQTQSGDTPKPDPFPLDQDPAERLIQALQSQHVILFSPDLARHREWDGLCDRLSALPECSRRCTAVGTEKELWERLCRQHGASFRLFAEPLGWRASLRSI